MNATKEKYINVTYKYKLKNRTKPKVIELNYYESNGKKYYVDGKNVVLDYSQKEYEIAMWLSKTFGSTVCMCPRINVPEGIKTADYYWNNEYWDLKEITKYNCSAVDYAIKKHHEQTSNFILDFSNCDIEIREIKKQIYKLYTSPRRVWVSSIIIKTKNNKYYVFKRK